MHINVRQSSKSRILLTMIEQYQKHPDDAAMLEVSKQNSIQQIEKRFVRSDTNKIYTFPRTKIQEEKLKTESPLFQQHSPKEIKKDNFKELMKKIYLSNLKKTNTKSNLKSDFIKQQYSILQQTHRKSIQNHNKTQLQQSLSYNRLLTDIEPKKSYSRGNSPELKQFTTNRSISTQLAKFMNQKKKEKPSKHQPPPQQNSCRSFELRYQFNKSPQQLLSNKSYDFIKHIQQYSSLKKQ